MGILELDEVFQACSLQVAETLPTDIAIKDMFGFLASSNCLASTKKTKEDLGYVCILCSALCSLAERGCGMDLLVWISSQSASRLVWARFSLLAQESQNVLA